MASIYTHELTHADWPHCVDVGEANFFRSLTATRVVVPNDKSDPVVFGKQSVPLRVGFVTRECLEYGGIRFEVKVVKSEDSNAIERGDHLYVAICPYSSGKAFQRRFRLKAPHKDDVVRQFQKYLSDDKRSDTEAKRWLDTESAVDIWENGKLLTAGSFELSNVFAGQNLRENSKLVLGTSSHANLQGILAESVEAKKLLRMTAEGTIAVGPKGRKRTIRLDQSELRDEGNSLLYQSICQALAGPTDDFILWEGKSVMKLVEQIYKNHLDNFVRRRRPLGGYQFDESRDS